MISRVLVFEDEPKDREKFKKAMEAIGCQVKTFDTHDVKKSLGEKEILSFNPQLAIVDSMFESEIDGIEIVKHLNKTFKGIPIIICTILADDPQKRNWIENEYNKLTGVWAVIGKDPFPNGQQIVDLIQQKK